MEPYSVNKPRDLGEIQGLAERKTGLVFCHGRAHQLINPFLLNMADWYYLDIKPTANPDIVASYDNPDNLKEYLRLTNGKLFDYVLIYHCSISIVNFNESILRIMISARRALNSTGQFIFHNYMGYVADRLVRSRSKFEQSHGSKFSSIYDSSYVGYLLDEIDQLKLESLTEIDQGISEYRQKLLDKIDLQLNRHFKRSMIVKNEDTRQSILNTIQNLEGRRALIINESDENLNKDRIKSISIRITNLERELPLYQIKGEDADEFERQIPLQPDSLLNACYSFANMLLFETGYQNFGYLNDLYRPAYYQNNQLALTIVFYV